MADAAEPAAASTAEEQEVDALPKAAAAEAPAEAAPAEAAAEAEEDFEIKLPSRRDAASEAGSDEEEEAADDGGSGSDGFVTGAWCAFRLLAACCVCWCVRPESMPARVQHRALTAHLQAGTTSSCRPRVLLRASSSRRSMPPTPQPTPTCAVCASGPWRPAHVCRRGGRRSL
jgi:hypothetical protein